MLELVEYCSDLLLNKKSIQGLLCSMYMMVLVLNLY